MSCQPAALLVHRPPQNRSWSSTSSLSLGTPIKRHFHHLHLIFPETMTYSFPCSSCYFLLKRNLICPILNNLKWSFVIQNHAVCVVRWPFIEDDVFLFSLKDIYSCHRFQLEKANALATLAEQEAANISLMSSYLYNQTGENFTISDLYYLFDKLSSEVSYSYL